MDPLLALGITILMSFIPAVLFLGLFRGLRLMQSSTLVQNSGSRINSEVKEITLSDASTAIFGNSSVLSDSSSTSKFAIDGVCEVCGTENKEMATYCRSCESKLN